MLRLGLPATVARWVPGRPWLKVQVAASPWMSLHGKRLPLELYPVAAAIPDEQLATLARGLLARRREPLGVVTSQRLRNSARTVLEELGVPYVDGKGRLHFPAQGLLIHLEVESVADTPNSRAPGLGPGGVRAVQALLAANEPLPLARLSERTGLSLAQTHAAYRVLEEAGLLRTTGVGPARRRAVVDRGQLLDWLAAQPAARRREARLDVSVYARRPEELWRNLASRFNAEGVPYALTGAAGAAVHGAGPTAVPLTSVRIPPSVPLERAAALLGAEPDVRGANVRLLRDTGLVGTALREEARGISVAPRVRVYLDALGELRGDDVAQHFREQSLGY